MRRTKQDVNNLSKQNKIEPMGEEINTKVEIIECAVNLFKNHGYDQVTVAQICKEVGISKTSFYYHFANSAARAATARRNSRTSPEEEPQCPGVSAAGSSVR